jgi:hypothetical protein
MANLPFQVFGGGSRESTAGEMQAHSGWANDLHDSVCENEDVRRWDQTVDVVVFSGEQHPVLLGP